MEFFDIHTLLIFYIYVIYYCTCYYFLGFPEQTDVNYSDCAKEVKETVSTLRKTPSMSGQTIYAISGYYSALTSHKLIDDQDGK